MAKLSARTITVSHVTATMREIHSTMETLSSRIATNAHALVVCGIARPTHVTHTLGQWSAWRDVSTRNKATLMDKRSTINATCAHVWEIMPPTASGNNATLTSCFFNGLEITNGQSTDVKCNTCTCYRGFLGCTENECLTAIVEPQPEPDNTRVNTDPSIKCYVDDKTYTNGQEFWKDCNQCRCYDDGQARCDTNFCTPGLCFMEGVGYPSGKILLSETQMIPAHQT